MSSVNQLVTIVSVASASAPSQVVGSPMKTLDAVAPFKSGADAFNGF
ncbi:MAG: hypothetical protein P8L30_03325 [Longimicrobiales bacterium]|nr:hypothetical protein [Gemmatimonadales bacterium]MDG2239207.1 hypothetical protein [Longimicrobiales bacterium]MBT4914607.1 hypothetical protein [Gemmatimonadales bacterium]MBT6695977.1 hypothetical protein [Gemmatimonadales bacterium]MBT6889676.1 hypothetical protein [Gemmatimonadales bacterium]